MTKRNALAFVVACVLTLAVACGNDDTVATEATETTMADAMASDADAMEDMDHDDTMADGHDHHELVEVAAGDAPAISVTATPDAVSGANLAITLDNFTITPENASTDHVDGEGHLHLFVDGARVGRLYATAVHVALEPGDHEIMVQVSSNDHRTYGVDGTAIEAMTSVVIEPSEHHHHGDDLVVAEAVQPSIAIEAFDDPKSGVNVAVSLADFTITPENASSDHVDGEGHLHLYVDGVKQGRLYGEWVHVDGLSDGEHLIEVEVSANDHRTYDDGTGSPLRAAVTVVSDDGFEAAADTDSHDHDHAGDDHGAEAMDDADMAMADHVVDVEVVGGDVTGGPQRVEVEVGSSVLINVTSDAPDEIHVHAYDLFADVAAGETASVMFEANIPGIVEIELEGSGTLLVNLAVS